MERLTNEAVRVDESVSRYLGPLADIKGMKPKLLDLILNGPTLNGVSKDVLRQIIRQLYTRLAAYEDPGLEPEEVLPKDKADEIALKLMRLADLENLCSYTRLRELAEADKNGRVVVLPCKPDAIYWERSGSILAQSRFEGLHVCEDGTIKYAGSGMEICAEDIGKTVFLAHEEAKKALEARK